MKNIIFIIGILCLLIACESETSESSQQTGEQLETAKNQQCFMIKNAYDEIEVDGEMVELADVVQLSLTINGDEVVGRYDYVPAEKDAMWGEFKGTIDENKKITGRYIAIQEGMTTSEEIIIQLNDNNVLVYEETLPKTDCSDLLSPPDYAVNIEHVVEDIYTGTYEYEDETSSGSVVVEMVDNYTISFEIEIGSMEGCTGEISGNATIESMGFATFSDENCGNIWFRFMDDKLTLEEEDCSHYHGMACTFSEEYLK